MRKNNPENPSWRQLVAFYGLMLIGFLAFNAAAPGIVNDLVHRSNADGNSLGQMEPVVRWGIPVLGAVLTGALTAMAIGSSER